MAVCAVLALASVYVDSEAILERRYPLASAISHVDAAPQMVARGAHLMQIAGCKACHGDDLEGRRLASKIFPSLYSSNLTLAAQSMTGEEIERAIRFAVAPDATSLWAMPSGSYTYMSPADLGAILAFLKSRKPAGTPSPGPHFTFAVRWALVTGKLSPAVDTTAQAPGPLDLGPRYDGGRYLARLACGECHGTELEGRGAAGDLGCVSRYTLPAFFDLLRRDPHGRRDSAVRRLAHERFHEFADYEIMALFDYLQARAHASPRAIAHARALRRQQEKLLAGK